MSAATIAPAAADGGDRPVRLDMPARFVKSRTPVLSIQGKSGVVHGRRRLRQREA